MSETIKEISWGQFKDSGLLWCVNRTLHLFGMAIVVICDENDKIERVYPARVKFRGFQEELETNGFKKLHNFLSSNIKEIEKETNT